MQRIDAVKILPISAKKNDALDMLTNTYKEELAKLDESELTAFCETASV
jgi:hypothetical protein